MFIAPREEDNVEGFQRRSIPISHPPNDQSGHCSTQIAGPPFRRRNPAIIPIPAGYAAQPFVRLAGGAISHRIADVFAGSLRATSDNTRANLPNTCPFSPYYGGNTESWRGSVPGSEYRSAPPVLQRSSGRRRTRTRHLRSRFD